MQQDRARQRLPGRGKATMCKEEPRSQCGWSEGSDTRVVGSDGSRVTLVKAEALSGESVQNLLVTAGTTVFTVQRGGHI